MPLTSDILHDVGFNEAADADTRDAFARHVFGRVIALGDVRPTAADIAAFLAVGRYYQEPNLHGYRRGEMRSCWSNAYCVADTDRNIRYVQGWVFVPRYATAFPHAWCTDQQDRLIEVTWDCDNARGDEVYFGVDFDRFTLAAIKVADPVHGWHNGFASVLQREAQRASATLTPRSSEAEGRSR